jgi:glycerophosphoryl diester phosphodiesterase
VKPYLTHEHPLRLAHRGSRVLWPENTMVAFQGAIDLGYRYLETDVHASRDGVVVLFHDAALHRLTDGRGKVWEWTWDVLQTLDAAYHFDPEGGYPLRGTGVRIPTLEEAAATFPEALFNLDLKQRGIEERLAAEVERLGLADRVLIGSFHDGRIRRFRAVTKGRVATSAGPLEVSAALTAARLGRPVRTGADAFQVPERGGPLRVVGRRFIDAVHSGGAQVHVWTVNDLAAMRRLLDAGVDGIVTDRPDLLNEAVKGRS